MHEKLEKREFEIYWRGDRIVLSDQVSFSITWKKSGILEKMERENLKFSDEVKEMNKENRFPFSIT